MADRIVLPCAAKKRRDRDKRSRIEREVKVMEAGGIRKRGIWGLIGALGAVLILTALPCQAQSGLPDGFVDLRQLIPGAQFDIRYFGPHNFVGRPVDGYLAPKCIVTKKAAAALVKVQEELQGFSLSLKFYDCYRPQRAVDHFARWAKDIADVKTQEEFYPTVDKRNLFRDGYIAERSGHSRGSTVDLTIVPVPVSEQAAYQPGQPLYACSLPAGKRFGDNSVDMGTGFDCFHELSHPQNLQVGLAQRMNRMLLKVLMDKHGFKNYDQEWWHFTLREEPFPDRYFDFPIQ